LPLALEQSLPLPQAPPVVTEHDPAFSKPSSAAPFAPLPKDFADNRFTFILPINCMREL
jgi:hypothetical protein